MTFYQFYVLLNVILMPSALIYSLKGKRGLIGGLIAAVLFGCLFGRQWGLYCADVMKWT